MSNENNIADWGDQDQNPESTEQDVPSYVQPEPAYDLSVADPGYEPSAQAEAVMGEAVRRIEQANLYQTVLKHDLFAPGSARQEILDQVQSEIRDFILGRLEILLGMKSDEKKSQLPVSVKAELPFDDEQVEVLQALANRALKRNQPAVTQPTINLVTQAAPQPTPQPIMKPIQPQIVQPPVTQARRPVGRPPQVTQPARPVASGTKPRRRRSNNVSQVKDDNGNVISDKDYSQAVPQGNAPKPMRMPSQNEQNGLAAAQAARNSSNLESGNKLLNVALMDALAKTKHLPDGE